MLQARAEVVLTLSVKHFHQIVGLHLSPCDLQQIRHQLRCDVNQLSHPQVLLLRLLVVQHWLRGGYELRLAVRALEESLTYGSPA